MFSAVSNLFRNIAAISLDHEFRAFFAQTTNPVQQITWKKTIKLRYEYWLLFVLFCIYACVKFIWVAVLYHFIVGIIVYVGKLAMRSFSDRAIQEFMIQSGYAVVLKFP